ncbi:MAG: Gfo/Idh/MocA family oxidoreductase, partial [Trueperaceae bacterium]
MTATRIVLAGLGARGAYWREVIDRDPRAVAVAFVDPSPEARTRSERDRAEVPTFATVADALASVSADAVVLATPPTGRGPDLEAVFGAGLPALVEKPLALDLGEAAGFVRQAHDAGTALMIGLNFRYLAVTQALRGLLTGGPLGDPAFARFTYERWRDGNLPRLNKYPLVMEQPMLWEQSIHHFDLMRYVYDREPRRISCRTFNPPWSLYASDANVTAWIEMDDGLVVDYQGTWQSNHVVPTFEWRTEAQRGVAFQRDMFGRLSWALRDQESPTAVDLPEHETWITDTSGLLDAFLRHVRDGAPLACSGLDHLRSLAMVEACIEASVDDR